MLSHSGLLHAGMMPPAGDHPGLSTYLLYMLHAHVSSEKSETISHRHVDKLTPYTDIYQLHEMTLPSLNNTTFIDAEEVKLKVL